MCALFKKYFTIEQATGLLPVLTSLLERIKEAQCGLGQITQEAQKIHSAAGGNGGGEHSTELLERSAIVAKYLQQINELGVQIKDLDIGLFDFPHIRDGREVFLCWKKGEKKIAFWHELDEGFQGRQPL